MCECVREREKWLGAKIQVFNRRRPSSSISEFSLEVKKKKGRDVPVIRERVSMDPMMSLCVVTSLTLPKLCAY